MGCGRNKRNYVDDTEKTYKLRGVDLIVNKKLSRHLKDIKEICIRVIFINIQFNARHTLMVIQGYAPT